MNGFEQYQYAEIMRQSRNSALYHILLARQGVVGGTSSESVEPVEPIEPVGPKETTFHFRDYPDETYLIEGEINRLTLDLLGIYDSGDDLWKKHLTSVEFGSAITIIGYFTLRGGKFITSIKIPNTVLKIERDAFRYCINLTSIIIPSSVESIGENVLANCTNLKSVTMSGKTMEIVHGMSEYPWGLNSDCIIHCTDGDIEL